MTNTGGYTGCPRYPLQEFLCPRGIFIVLPIWIDKQRVSTVPVGTQPQSRCVPDYVLDHRLSHDGFSNNFTNTGGCTECSMPMIQVYSEIYGVPQDLAEKLPSTKKKKKKEHPVYGSD